jgi:hypothetical protein
VTNVGRAERRRAPHHRRQPAAGPGIVPE